MLVLASLFEPITLNGVTIPNRIVKSAMAEGRADAEGRPTPGLVRMYARWARGGVGLAITGMAHVRRGYSFTDHEIGLYDDSLVEPMKALTDAVHDEGGRIFAQLCHAPPQLPRAKAKALGALAPSAGFNRTNLLWDREIDGRELESIARDFGSAACRARDAGFDGVQLHAAHGYLLSRMLSPLFNRRKDRWGGDAEGRSRLVREVYEHVRRAVGADFPITIKLNAHDGVPHGLDVDYAVSVARDLEAAGLDAVEVSAGTADVGLGFYPNRGEIPVDLGMEYLRQAFPSLGPVVPLLRPVIRAAARTVRFDEEGYFVPLARRFADELSIPVIAVGGIRTLEAANRIRSDSRISMVSLARPLVRQPSLARDWRHGRSTTAQCRSCNECFVRVGLGQPLRCWSKVRRPGT